MQLYFPANWVRKAAIFRASCAPLEDNDSITELEEAVEGDHLDS